MHHVEYSANEKGKKKKNRKEYTMCSHLKVVCGWFSCAIPGYVCRQHQVPHIYNREHNSHIRIGRNIENEMKANRIANLLYILSEEICPFNRRRAKYSFVDLFSHIKFLVLMLMTLNALLFCVCGVGISFYLWNTLNAVCPANNST